MFFRHRHTARGHRRCLASVFQRRLAAELGSLADNRGLRAGREPNRSQSDDKQPNGVSNTNGLDERSSDATDGSHDAPPIHRSRMGNQGGTMAR
jgi:hypothetical protein